MHHQRGIGRHQINQALGKSAAQALAGGEHPRHVAFVDAVEQAHHQAVDGHHLNTVVHGTAWASRA
ncbi:hypothetical protein D3C84_986870 [compost metagenome]